MNSLKLTAAALFFGVLGFLALAWFFATLGRGEYTTGTVILGIAAFCLGLAIPIAFKTLPGRVTPQCACDASGTTIRPDKLIELSAQVALTGGTVGMGLFAVLHPLGRLDIPIPHSFRYSLPLMGGAVAVLGAPMLWRTFKRGGYKFLKLTPDGFEISEGSTSPRGAWADVRDVSDRVPGEPPPRDYNTVVIAMSDGRTPAISADSITPGGRALREWVRFYWQHPEHRGELTDGRAIERLRSEELAAE